MVKFLLPLLITILLSGCAKTRWSTPLPEEDLTAVDTILSTMQDEQESCTDTLEADAKVTWKTPLEESGVMGYLQLLSPSSMKYIITNPLGMMVYAFSSNGKTFQILDTIQRQHIRGNVRNLVIRHRLPLIFAEGEWFNYLTGRLPPDRQKVSEAFKDTENQTIWIRFSKKEGGTSTAGKWIHIDPEKHKLLSYLFLDTNGETLAEVSYGKQMEAKGSCMPPTEVHITNLPWDSEIKVILNDIATDTHYDESVFKLPVPTGYYKQLQP